MPKEKNSLNPSNIYQPFGKYSHAIFNQKTGLLISSGQLGITKGGLIPTKFIEQTELCFSNIRSIIQEADFSLDDILKVSAFVTDRKYFKIGLLSIKNHCSFYPSFTIAVLFCSY